MQQHTGESSLSRPLDLHGKMHVRIVTPGEVITPESEGFLRGHGTYVEDGKLISSVCGVVERVNKLIIVRPLRARYQGEIGDVVVGRITEVAHDRWKVDIQGRQHAVLLLSSIHLPGGVQRRKTAEDQLNMRKIFVENDLISAEVQQFFQDGSMSLQTRSLRYGKLQNGQFVRVPSALVKRCKQHFHTFDFGVEVILGNNGYLWITVPRFVTKAPTGSTSTDQDDTTVNSSSQSPLTREEREKICRVHNAIVALSRQFLAIYPETITDVYNASLHLPLRDMLSPDVMPLISQAAIDRIQEANAKIKKSSSSVDGNVNRELQDSESTDGAGFFTL